jgi:hypothetical protein
MFILAAHYIQKPGFLAWLFVFVRAHPRRGKFCFCGLFIFDAPLDAHDLY